MPKQCLQRKHDLPEHSILTRARFRLSHLPQHVAKDNMLMTADEKKTDASGGLNAYLGAT